MSHKIKIVFSNQSRIQLASIFDCVFYMIKKLFLYNYNFIINKYLKYIMYNYDFIVLFG